MNFMDVRERICALDENRFWTVGPNIRPEYGIPHFVIMDTLIEQIRKSKVFICVLRDVYGSSLFGKTESVSFLETEIYQAALFHSNAHFFLMEPFNPDERLRGLLELVDAIRPGIIPSKAVPEQQVLDGIKRIIEHTAAQKRRPWAVSLHKLVGEIASRRGHPKPDIEFLDNVFCSIYKEKDARPDKDHIEVLLNDLDGDTGVEQRLTRMWVALRELSAAPYDQPAFKEYLPLWDRALGAWTSAAAWYGLHGHLYAGRLAGVNSLLKIRAAMDWKGAEHGAPHYIHGTKGGRASEYYSMAKLMPRRAQRDEYLGLALTDLDDALRFVSGDVSGYLAIRGHVYCEQGRFPEALRDFEEMRRLRELRGDAGGVGEALADLGLIYLRLGDIRKARSLLRAGAEMLANANRYEFAIRAKKRLALSYLRLLQPYRAFREICEAYDMAQERQVYGQITPLMEIVHEFENKVGAWNRKHRPRRHQG